MPSRQMKHIKDPNLNFKNKSLNVSPSLEDQRCEPSTEFLTLVSVAAFVHCDFLFETNDRDECMSNIVEMKKSAWIVNLAD